MGGVLQTIKFLSAAAGVGLCLNGMDKLAQRIDECVLEGGGGGEEQKEEARWRRKKKGNIFSLFASQLDLLRSFEHANAERRERERDARARMVALRDVERETPKRGGEFRVNGENNRERPFRPRPLSFFFTLTLIPKSPKSND